MSIKSFAAKVFARIIVKRTRKWAGNAKATQDRVFQDLIKKGVETKFGMDHDFGAISNHKEFVQRIPIRDYESLKGYFDLMAKGEADVLWPGKPLYIAKTSGTTSGAKYIPLTAESMPNHINAARDAILSYIHETGNSEFVDGKMIFLQGNPKLKEENGIKIGRLSGIVAHFVPSYLQKNRLPSWETNCIDDWEEKVDAIVSETIEENMTVISGIPSWVQMYFERLQHKSGKKIGDLFKNFNLFIYGGVNYEPYRQKFEDLIGRKVPSIELYPASEGFFAYQDKQNGRGMLLLLNSGIFYEFVKAEDFHDENAKRITVSEVELGVNYVMIISTNAGLWAYNIGDTVQFTCLNPYRVIVSGRLKHFISAFGEHVIGKEVEEAMQLAIEKFKFSISEFTVAPQTSPANGGLPYHEWLIEFETSPEDIEEVAKQLDLQMMRQNSYYKDLIDGKILQPLKITGLPKDSFKNLMKAAGKLGGQNKVPRLSNDRKIADKLYAQLPQN